MQTALPLPLQLAQVVVVVSAKEVPPAAVITPRVINQAAASFYL